MKRKVAMLMLAAAVLAPAALLAHEGHTHRVMGTIDAIDATKVVVKDTAGTLVPFVLTRETKFLRGDDPVLASEARVGERVMVEGMEHANRMIAATVRLGAMDMK